MNKCLELLKRKGILSSIAGFEESVSFDFHIHLLKGPQVRIGIHSGEAILDMMKWIEEGILKPSFIFTHTSSLNDIMIAYEVFSKKNGWLY